MTEREFDSESWNQVEALFTAAIELDPSERQAFVDKMCARDAKLRRELEEMLAAAEESNEFLESPAIAALPGQNGSERLPESIGGYRIKRVIASGGMGTVYEAEQQHPRRAVALKVIRAGLVSPEARRRFEYESQLLSRLRHPGIAQVYEAGVHVEAGQRLPFFAMEFVPLARPITQYAADEKQGLRERLELFARVCDAIEHGHQRSVIHRDLKPSNILVGEDGEPRVIDFGVARSTDADVARTTMHTEAGELVGTLQYMSPEQCSGEVERIDTRSDVYTLGVVLFELLSGQRPYDMSGRSVYEGTRIVIETSPSHLSAIDHRLGGDLETIVAKTMEKGCDRRYGSAGELAADIRRFLNGDAITARPPSRTYRLRVFARRNKAVVAAVTAVLIALIAGLVGTGTALVKTNRARSESEQVTNELAMALSSVDPEVARGKEVTVREVLDSIAGRLGKDSPFGKDSLAEADLRMTIGKTYRHLGLYDKAVPHMEAALDVRRRVLGDHVNVVNSLAELALLYGRQGNLEGHDRLSEEALEIHESRGFPDSIDAGMCVLMQGSKLMREEDFAAAKLEIERSLAMFRRIQGEGSREIAWAMNNLGLLHMKMGDYEAAEQCHRETLAMRLAVLGPDHPHVWYSYTNLATVAWRTGDVAAQGRWLLKEKDFACNILGQDHPLYAASFYEYGTYLLRRGQPSQAEPVLREAVTWRAKLTRQEQIEIRQVLGTCLRKLGKYEEGAEELLGAFEELHSIDGKISWKSDLERECCSQLATLYEAWDDKPEEAAYWQTKAVKAATSGRGSRPSNHTGRR